MMKYLTAAALFTAIAAPAFAEPACTMPDSPLPVWESMKSFEEQGGTVISFKINDGQCYEIYGTVDGTKYEVFFDPATGEELERIEG